MAPVHYVLVGLLGIMICVSAMENKRSDSFIRHLKSVSSAADKKRNDALDKRFLPGVVDTNPCGAFGCDNNGRDDHYDSYQDSDDDEEQTEYVHFCEHWWYRENDPSCKDYKGKEH